MSRTDGQAAHPRPGPGRDSGRRRVAAPRSRARRGRGDRGRVRARARRPRRVGRRDARPSGRRRRRRLEEIDGRGLAAIPGLVDCHTHPAFAGDRAHEFALRASGATYEELLAAGGGILSTTRATRAAGPVALREIVERHRDAMLANGHHDVRGQERLRARPRHGARAARRGPGGWRRAHLARRARGAARAPRRRRVRRLAHRGRAPRRGQDRRRRGRVRRARHVRRRAGPSLPARLPRSRARAPTPRRPAVGDRRGSARGRARGAFHRPPGGHRARRRSGSGGERRRRRPAADRCALPRPADAACSGARRCGGDRRPRNRLQPRERLLREPAGCLHARVHAARALA